jgi:hypothetical protein
MAELDTSKIAVCVSGLSSMVSDYKLIREIQAKVFPYDTFFLEWNGYPKADIPNVKYVDEPTWEYHVLAGTTNPPKCAVLHRYIKPGGKIWRNNKHGPRLALTSYRGGNQIIAHAHLIDSLDPKYTTIVRIRWDTVVSTRADYTPYLKMAQEGTVVGFDASNGKLNHGANPDMYHHTPPKVVSSDPSKPNLCSHGCERCQARIWDQLIFHPRWRFKNAFEMKQQKKLVGAEWGWWQILAEQWGENKFVNVVGGECLAKWNIAPKEEWPNL